MRMCVSSIFNHILIIDLLLDCVCCASNREILLECGIACSNSGVDDVAELDIPRHRVLIFAQLKSSLDLLVSTLFKPLMPTVTFMRLDGMKNQYGFDIDDINQFVLSSPWAMFLTGLLEFQFLDSNMVGLGYSQDH
jgi:hypothetical protein